MFKVDVAKRTRIERYLSANDFDLWLEGAAFYDIAVRISPPVGAALVSKVFNAVKEKCNTMRYEGWAPDVKASGLLPNGRGWDQLRAWIMAHEKEVAKVDGSVQATARLMMESRGRINGALITMHNVGEIMKLCGYKLAGGEPC